MSKKVLIGAGLAFALVLVALLAGAGLFVSQAFAQGPTPVPGGFPGYGACHNNTAVLDLLKLSQADLLKERQAGKSLLDIAKSKEVDEAKLVDALIQPMLGMHAWMAQTYGNNQYTDQMTQWMRDWITKDIRETKFGTMTDFRLGLGGNGPGWGMMGGYNGTWGPGMMGGYNGTWGPGMMGGYTGTPSPGWRGGGMMRGWTR